MCFKLLTAWSYCSSSMMSASNLHLTSTYPSTLRYRQEFPTFRIFGDRFSSRFSEYVFQYCRMAETNSPLCSVLGFKRHLRHFHLMIDDASTAGLKFPASKRGVQNDISRVDLAKHAAPPGWHLSDAEICEILDKVIGNIHEIIVMSQDKPLRRSL